MQGIHFAKNGIYQGKLNIIMSTCRLSKNLRNTVEQRNINEVEPSCSSPLYVTHTHQVA